MKRPERTNGYRERGEEENESSELVKRDREDEKDGRRNSARYSARDKINGQNKVKSSREMMAHLNDGGSLNWSSEEKNVKICSRHAFRTMQMCQIRACFVLRPSPLEPSGERR